MKHKAFIVLITAMCSFSLHAASLNQPLQQEIKHLQQATNELRAKLRRLQDNLHQQSITNAKKNQNQPPTPESDAKSQQAVHNSTVTVHSFDTHPELLGFYPTALMADQKIVSYIAGTPIVSSPFLGSRPAFDGSDYIVNISSINRDVRLMQQRRRLYQAYETLGYPTPDRPIIALSGQVTPIGTIGKNYFRNLTTDWNLGASELDVAAAVNDMVEGYIALAYDDDPPTASRQRIDNSALYLNMGFINIGNLDKTPFYFTAGQLYVPFGRFSSAMVSAPLTMLMGRTWARPVILGYKSQTDTGPFAAIYGFEGDTTLNSSGVGGVNLGYVFQNQTIRGEIGASYISALNDAYGMQFTGSQPGTTFGGFASITNGNEAVKKIPGVGIHGNVNIDRYNFTAEWVGASTNFRTQDLSFNGHGARPQAGQLEAGVTFMAFSRPSSFAVGYQWTKNALALNLPASRINGVVSTSIWKDTVESIEFRHDIDYKRNQFANGAAPIGTTNASTVGTGKTTDTVLALIAVYF